LEACAKGAATDFHELAANLATFVACTAAGSSTHLAVSRSAYDSLLMPLFSADLPERVATHLGSAYRRLALIEKLPRVSWDLMQEAQPDCEVALQDLMDYARTTLGVTAYLTAGQEADQVASPSVSGRTRTPGSVAGISHSRMASWRRERCLAAAGWVSSASPRS
jgi:hypothetical protein